MLDLLHEIPYTEFPIPPTTEYSKVAQLTVAHELANAKNAVGIPQVPTGELVKAFVDGLTPWVPVHPKGGKIAKRITDFFFKEYGLKLGNDYAQMFSTYLNMDLPAGMLRYDVTDRLENWTFGEFGDLKSCFEGKSILSTMQRNGGCALRLYGSSHQGIGRAWVMRGEDGHAMVFNCYGPSLDGFKSRLQLLMPDAKLELVRLVNKGRENGALWINYGTGIWVGEEGETPPTVIDLQVHTSDRPMSRCSLCLADYDDPWQIHRTGHGDLVCSECIEAYYKAEAVDGKWYLTSSLEQHAMAVPDPHTGNYIRGVGYVRPGQLELLRKCFVCGLPVYHNYTAEVSVSPLLRESACLCCVGDKLLFPYACGRCGRYMTETSATCACGKRVRQAR